MKTNKSILILFLLSFSLFLTNCKKDEPQDEESEKPTYTIKNNGNAGVSSILDTEDTVAPQIVQSIPSVDGGTYPKTTPIIMFLNDKVYLNSIEDNIEVKYAVKSENKEQLIGGTVIINESANGYAILSFLPYVPFEANKQVIFTLSKGLQDDGGNNFLNDYVLTFSTTTNNSGNFDGNESFENGLSGVYFEGDGAIMQGAQGCVSATSGSHFCAITSGSNLISNGSAIGGTTSLVTLGPIDQELSSISFDYNFLSTEFQEYVGSEFDDTFMVIIFGTDGAHTEFITSVNTVGTEGNTECSDFPGIPDDGDSYAGSTGWLEKTISFDNVGKPSYIIFTVTDVADDIFSSVAAIDNISLN
ncbi:MAG TPA: hypothetical protein EYG92_06485 [Lutibacter sp.]|nr:hypothetical protein [Lutibacter sp.]